MCSPRPFQILLSLGLSRKGKNSIRSWKDDTPNSNRFQISARRSVVLGEIFVLLCLNPGKHIRIDLKTDHDSLFSKLS